MNWLENVLSPELVRAVGWTIVHSLWQGAIVGLALVGLLLVLRRHSAQVRYNVAGLALLTMLGLALATFGRHYAVALASKNATAAVSATPAATQELTLLRPAAEVSAQVAEQSTSLLETGRLYFDQHLPLIVAVWFLGLLAMTLRMLGGLAYVQRLRHYRVEPLSDHWNERLNTLAERAGLKRTVTLLESALVKAPLVAGHLKPVILLPLGTVMGLSQAQLEAILAHELAHIARRDYLMNILQSVAEILFFYHPAAWFITACMRTERENCCDDEATAICGDPLTLAKALAALAEMGQDVYPAPRLAMSAVGPDGSLLGRIRRLVQRRAAPTFSEGFMAALVVVGGLALIGLTTVVSMANPRPWPEKAKELVGAVFGPENSVWANSLHAIQQVGVEPAPLALAPAAPAAPAPGDDDDDKKKRKKNDKHTVIVRDADDRGLRSGKDGGTVVVKRDKKGRITELYVDGQRIEMDEKGKQKELSNSTEVIRLSPESRSRRSRPNSNFNFDFDSRNYGMSARDQEELRSSMRRLEQDLERNKDQIRRGMAQAYVFNDGNRVEVRTGKDQMTNQDRIAAKALQDAERSLREAERNEPNAEAREKIREELERIQERREDLRERQEEIRERDRDAAQAERERAQVERERLQIERERIQVERERVRAEREKERAARSEQTRKAEEAMVDELLKDKLIKDRNNFQFVLKTDELVVNGEKQPEAVASKYRKLFEDGTGRTLTGNASVVFSNAGGNHNRIYTGTNSSKYFSVPPTPPAAPGAPSAPRAPRLPRTPRTSMVPPAAPDALDVPNEPDAPASPRAPRAPRPPRTTKVNSVALGEQLRKDGLIDPSARSYQLQLNAAGMSVNGQKQPEATAKRYRELLGKNDGKNFNMDIVVTE